MSELVETALRLLFASRRQQPQLPPLPAFRSGGHLVDVADRDALYQAMEGGSSDFHRFPFLEPIDPLAGS